MKEEVQTKLGFVLKPGTKWATAWAAAPAALAGFQAAAAQRQLGEVRTDMDTYIKGRQAIENPFANMSNPYENLAVATQAAEIKMEQTDQALANTLDTLRETGAAAGGATAIARAALESKKGIAASIETQEVNNQKLQAQGQLQVDIAKGKGETIRMEAQELRDTNELNRLQNQSDMAQYRRDTSIQSGLGALGDAAGVRNAGIVPEQKDQKDAANTPYTEEELELLRTGNSDSDPSKVSQAAKDGREAELEYANRVKNKEIDAAGNVIPTASTNLNQGKLNYTGSFSDISDDVKIRDGKMQAPSGWNEQEAQNRINSWYSMNKENNLANK